MTNERSEGEARGKRGATPPLSHLTQITFNKIGHLHTSIFVELYFQTIFFQHIVNTQLFHIGDHSFLQILKGPAVQAISFLSLLFGFYKDYEGCLCWYHLPTMGFEYTRHYTL